MFKLLRKLFCRKPRKRGVLIVDKMLLRTFQRHVAAQCKFLLAAASDANDAMAKKDLQRVFYALQNLLNAGANISKAFWGSGGKLSAERKPLRDSIGLDDKSPLREVAMRNNFEHFDERIDRWWTESKRHNLIDFNIGVMVAGVEDIDIMRNFDPKSNEVIFGGQRFNLQSLLDEARRLLPLLEAEAKKPHW